MVSGCVGSGCEGSNVFDDTFLVASLFFMGGGLDIGRKRARQYVGFGRRKELLDEGFAEGCELRLVLPCLWAASCAASAAFPPRATFRDRVLYG